jgi:hypothetical protein
MRSWEAPKKLAVGRPAASVDWEHPGAGIIAEYSPGCPAGSEAWWRNVDKIEKTW